MHGWTRPLVIAYAVAEAVFALPLVWVLYRQEFFNPGFVTAVSEGWAIPDAVYTVAALGVLVVSASNVVKYVREAR